MPDCRNCGYSLLDRDAFDFEKYHYEAHGNLYDEIEDIPAKWRDEYYVVPSGAITKYLCPVCGERHDVDTDKGNTE